ncbi:MAG TPA: nitrilase-related carbon-nitrogen hydrolase, partial [Candidatus Synoicihabitans sp.]|nr:nitrilase-related carbon-nitrogen hydrolase [Candidatus Synoicihabitans sp.]
MRLGLAQLNTTVGDLAGNRRKILAAYHELVAAGAEVIVYPELVVCGYPPRDLLFKRSFGPDMAESLREIARETGAVPAVIGTIVANPLPEGRPFFNAAALCQDGEVKAVAHKCLLPTYDVFDEDRYFQPAANPTVFEIQGRRVGVTICEDLWTRPPFAPRDYPFDPVKWLADEDVSLMFNLSASPWQHGKGDLRQALVTDAARLLGCPVV